MSIRPISDDDIFEWPDGTWCFRYESAQYLAYLSDDYRVVPVGDPAWDDITQERV